MCQRWSKRHRQQSEKGKHAPISFLRRRNNVAEAIFKRTMAVHFPNLMKDIIPRFKKSKHEKHKEIHITHSIAKPQKTIYKETIFKAAREKEVLFSNEQ